MPDAFSDIARELEEIRDANLWKTERRIVSPQAGHIKVDAQNTTHEVINLCANNYLGLADHPELIAAAHAALDSHGLGMASVRFICGTSQHRSRDHGLLSGCRNQAQAKDDRRCSLTE